MSYTPTNWKAGDVVTSAKLNKMEQGIAASGGIRVVHLTFPSGLNPSMSTAASMQLDITPNELMDAFENDEIVVITASNGRADGGQYLISVFSYDDETTYTVKITDTMHLLTSSDPDEYFTYDPNSSDDSGNAPD